MNLNGICSRRGYWHFEKTLREAPHKNSLVGLRDIFLQQALFEYLDDIGF